MSQPTASRQAARWRAYGAVALARFRLRATWGGRLAKVVASGGVLAILALLAFTQLGGRRSVDATTILVAAARWLPWIVTCPIALAASGDLRTRDHDDGIVALAALRGLSPGALDASRVLAAMVECAAFAAAPLAIIGIFASTLGRGMPLVLSCARTSALTTVFGLSFGVTVGAVAATCGRIARRRGPLLFGIVVLGPWIAAEVAGLGTVSLPSGLAALFDFVVGRGAG